MSVEVRLRPRAKQDIIEAAHFIAKDSVTSAERFLDAMIAALETLSESPEIGTQREFSHGSLRKMRIWPVRGFNKYIVFYHLREDTVDVFRVLHGARDIGAEFFE